jgi:hypothetical protein
MNTTLFIRNDPPYPLAERRAKSRRRRMVCSITVMPITIDQLRVPRADEPSLEDQILAFLERDPHHAFTLLEILAGVRGHPTVDAALNDMLGLDPLAQERIIHEYRNALGYLMLEDQIIAGERDGEGYYYRSPR